VIPSVLTAKNEEGISCNKNKGQQPPKKREREEIVQQKVVRTNKKTNSMNGSSQSSDTSVSRWEEVWLDGKRVYRKKKTRIEPFRCCI